MYQLLGNKNAREKILFQIIATCTHKSHKIYLRKPLREKPTNNKSIIGPNMAKPTNLLALAK
jgi:hypothetical protein